MSTSAEPPRPAAKPAETRETEIGREAYAFLYPLVIMDVTRRQALQRGGSSLAAPINTFHHSPAFPRGDFKAVVRPNFDTLYSSAWLDLAGGPVLLSIGDTKNRYYLLPLYDAWTDTFAIPGSETLPGDKPARFAITGPGWQGELPAGVERIEAPTRFVWIIGRIQTNGVLDYPLVHQIQQALTLTPLDPTKLSPTLAGDPPVDLTLPPVALVNRMSAAEFYETALRLMVDNPPHVTDQAQVARLGLIGLRASREFRFAGLPPATQAALTEAKNQGPARLLRYAGRNGQQRNGWRLNTLSVGTYGADYDQRAAVALVGLGANRPADSIYPSTSVDRDGNALNGQNRYVVHFKADGLPPARAFWSLTAYTAQGYTEPNAMDRYALGDRDTLTFNRDGSLDLLLQTADPGAGRRTNWLPVPGGAFNLSLRIYRPTPAALEGDWLPPTIERVTQK